jgi:hypothetical protein
VKGLPFDDAAPLAGGAGVNASRDRQDRLRERKRLRAECRAVMCWYMARLRGEALAYIRSMRCYGTTDYPGAKNLLVADYKGPLKDFARTFTALRRSLVARGLVVGTDRKRPTHTGRMARVWIAAEYDGCWEGGAS